MARCLNRVSENDVVIQRNAMTILDKLRKAAQGGGVNSTPRHTRIPKKIPITQNLDMKALSRGQMFRPAAMIAVIDTRLPLKRPGSRMRLGVYIAMIPQQNGIQRRTA
jgi:hypothetical protein